MSKIFAMTAAAALALAVWLASTPSSARVGERCRAFPGITCGPNEFCQTPTGVCFSPEVDGRCAAKPQFCPHVYRPVCGCNRETYANDCERMRAGMVKLHNGRC